MSLTVWQIDPAHLTPYYDASLCRALAREGWAVWHITSPFLYDPALPCCQEYQTDYLYFRQLKDRRWLQYPRLRQTLRALLYLVGHRQLLQRLDSDPPDVIHIQWSRLPKFDRWLLSQIRRRGIPIVHTVHDVEPLFTYAPSADLAAVYALADRLIVHTGANCEALLGRFPQIHQDRVRVIPHIAADWSMPPTADRESARRALGIPAEASVLLFFGTARSYKGLDMLVEAYRQARRVRPDLWLVIAGMQSDTPALARFRGKVVVHNEYIPSDRVWIYHRAADLAVFPYRRISQSGALITAMGFGLPVIVTNVGGLPETVDGNGWIVPPDDAAVLSLALVESVSDSSRLRRMGERSVVLIHERHAPQRIGAQTIDLYEEVISSCSASFTAPTI